jgi:hypothetical protein
MNHDPQDPMDAMRNDQVNKDPSFFGGCPKCGSYDGYFDMGRDHWFFCREHRVKWLWGSNMFSSYLSKGEQRQNYETQGFGSYAEVKPLFPPGLTEDWH